MLVSIPSAALVVLPLTERQDLRYAALRQGVWHILLLGTQLVNTIRQISSPGRNFSGFCCASLTASSRDIVRPCSIIEQQIGHLPLEIIRQHHAPPFFLPSSVAPDITYDKSYQHDKITVNI